MIGTAIGRYVVLEQLGAGGMGVVYRAHDQSLDRDVALKILPPEMVADADARACLTREARTASGLSHPGICAVYDVGEASGRTYLAMELIRGRLLSEAIPPGGMAPETVARYGVQIADALAHAHERGVIHRDLKASNAMITEDGRIKLLDFGLARHAIEGGDPTRGSSTITATGAVAGTTAYMAPELLQGGKADARSDLWSLGVLLYEMAAGVRPFQGRSGYELIAAILQASPAALPSGFRGLDSVIERCLSKDPPQRYRYAGEVRAALESSTAAIAEPRLESGARVRDASRRRTVLLGVGVSLALAVAALALNPSVRSRFVGRLAGTPIRSLAVLPLENLTHDPAEDYFADGMTDELIIRLGTLRDIRVVSRTSAMRFKGTRKPLREIGKELGVDAVVEGSALRSGDRVRISAELVDVARDRHLWARSYEHDMRDVLQLQAELAAAIAGEIRARLSHGDLLAAPRRIDSRAYEAYLKGRFHWNKRTERDLLTAIDYMNESVRLDSSFAPAYAGLAEVWVVLPSSSDRKVSECMTRARAAATKTLALDPSIAQAHSALGAIAANQGDWAGAEAEYQRAIELDSNYATAHQWLGELLSLLGRHDEAVAEARRAQQLDPVSIPVAAALAARLTTAQRVSEAEAAWKEVIRLDPSVPQRYYDLAKVYLMAGRFREAIAVFARGDSVGHEPVNYAAKLTHGLNSGGPRGFWRELLAISLGPGGSQPLEIAGIYTQLGEREKAFEWLERMVERNKHAETYWINVEWKLAPLRADPRFQLLVRRVGLPK